jgi:hypothetical protein
LINAPHGKEFVFQDGSKAKNILELVSVIERLNDHEFHHFVNAHKNDFANWAEHVLANKHFSEKLRSASTKSDTIQLIKEEINTSVSRGKFGGSILESPRLEDHSKSGHHSSDTHNSVETTVKDVMDSKEEKEEKKSELKAGRNWFKIFSKKSLSEKKIKSLERKEEDKLHVEEELVDEVDSEKHENALWVTLYIALVILIITLLVYKLFL